MFGSDDASEVKYYSAETAYGKGILRQAERMDVHVYKLLSGRIAIDTAQLKHFYAQDDRLQGQRVQRIDRRYVNGAQGLMEVFSLLPEAAESEQEIDKLAEVLIKEDKRSN